MPENNQPIGTDATGFDILSQAVRDLLNRFPGLEDGEEILYETLAADGGIAFSNNAGALVYTDREDICGNVRQTCRYPLQGRRGRERGKKPQRAGIPGYAGKMGLRRTCDDSRGI